MLPKGIVKRRLEVDVRQQAWKADLKIISYICGHQRRCICSNGNEAARKGRGNANRVKTLEKGVVT